MRKLKVGAYTRCALLSRKLITCTDMRRAQLAEVESCARAFAREYLSGRSVFGEDPKHGVGRLFGFPSMLAHELLDLLELLRTAKTCHVRTCAQSVECVTHANHLARVRVRLGA
jgi:hypothetical protein